LNKVYSQFILSPSMFTLRHKIKILPIAIALTLSACWPHGYNYNYGELPETPVNLQDFNSEYDDYNSTAPSLGYLIPFCFSTNRKSNGGDFDVIYEPMNVNFDKTTGVLKVTNVYDNWGILAEDYGKVLQAVKRINGEGNEFGPYLLYDREGDVYDFKLVLMYASDVGGDFDIGFTYNTDSTGFSESTPVEFLNSEANDYYPCFNKDFSEIYFCSDRENGVFNIYHTHSHVADSMIIRALKETETHTVEKESILSADSDDKCPFIFENTLVFTSNRSGGFGGFDLYYSKFIDGQWSIPVNFGEEINTEYDEYRPILFDEGVDNNRNMMVFSSNRPGGLGGFDLYFVGVSKPD